MWKDGVSTYISTKIQKYKKIFVFFFQKYKNLQSICASKDGLSTYISTLSTLIPQSWVAPSKTVWNDDDDDDYIDKDHDDDANDENQDVDAQGKP